VKSLPSFLVWPSYRTPFGLVGISSSYVLYYALYYPAIQALGTVLDAHKGEKKGSEEVLSPSKGSAGVCGLVRRVYWVPHLTSCPSSHAARRVVKRHPQRQRQRQWQRHGCGWGRKDPRTRPCHAGASAVAAEGASVDDTGRHGRGGQAAVRTGEGRGGEKPQSRQPQKKIRHG